MITDDPEVKFRRSTWPPVTDPNGFLSSFGAQPYVDNDEQPGFGIGIYWNNPEERRRPYVVFHVWRWVLCIGWLIDDTRGQPS